MQLVETLDVFVTQSIMFIFSTELDTSHTMNSTCGTALMETLGADMIIPHKHGFQF